MGASRLLHRTLPSLRRVPHLSLDTYPTPLQTLHLADIVHTFEGRAWVKREDRSGAELGGNKVRKLEFLLPRAHQVGARGVITLGGIGSNHCLATAFYGPEAALDVHLVLFPHNVTPQTRRTLRAICALGPTIDTAPTGEAAAALAAARAVASRLTGRRLYPILPGGSSVRGTLGWVEGGLELAAQIQAGELEEPDAIFCAYASGGTAAGLLIGLALAGLGPEIVAVQVYPAPLASAPMLRNLIWRTRRFLAARCDEPVPPVDASRIRVLGDYLGGGYAAPAESASAAREAAEALGLELETTYTGKAFAAFLDAAASRRYRDKRLLFVQTYDPSLGHRLGGEPIGDALVPERLRAYA